MPRHRAPIEHRKGPTKHDMERQVPHKYSHRMPKEPHVDHSHHHKHHPDPHTDDIDHGRPMDVSREAQEITRAHPATNTWPPGQNIPREIDYIAGGTPGGYRI